MTAEAIAKALGGRKASWVLTAPIVTVRAKWCHDRLLCDVGDSWSGATPLLSSWPMTGPKIGCRSDHD